MKSKKKLIIALSSFAFVLVAAVVTVTAVLAAVNQSVTSNVSVVYYAQQVAGKVTASYKIGAADAVEMGSITYKGEDKTSTTTMAPGKVIELNVVAAQDGSVEAEKVVFTYTFTNTGSSAYVATLKYTPDETPDVNMEATYSTNLTHDETAGSYSIVVPANTTTAMEVTVTVALKDVASNGTFSGTFGWTLVANRNAQ